MEKKFVLNRVDLGKRVTGYEVFNPGVNGGEVLGMTAKQLAEAVEAGEVLGMILDGEDLKLDKDRGFRALMAKTGVGKLVSTDPEAVATMMYTVYGRDGDKFKVVNSRFGRLTYCADKIKALLDLGAVNGVVLDGDKLVCAWEYEGAGKVKK